MGEFGKEGNFFKGFLKIKGVDDGDGFFLRGEFGKFLGSVGKSFNLLLKVSCLVGVLKGIMIGESCLRFWMLFFLFVVDWFLRCIDLIGDICFKFLMLFFLVLGDWVNLLVVKVWGVVFLDLNLDDCCLNDFVSGMLILSWFCRILLVLSVFNVLMEVFVKLKLLCWR